MRRDWMTQYSGWLERDMHVLVHGHGGVPVIAVPCQDGMCDNWESFQMQDTLGDYIESGRIQLFGIDTVDRESWSDTNGDKGWRAWMQERYFHYIVDEAVPFIRYINGGNALPIVTGFSLGATHAAIVFYRRPDIFSGMLACSGCYDARHFWDGWCDDNLYNNSPCQFLANMPNDHFYIDMYNHRRSAICCGQGAWENEAIHTGGILKDIFQQKGINTWVDFWGYDVNHDWPWWRKQIRYFMPWLLDGVIWT